SNPHSKSEDQAWDTVPRFFAGRAIRSTPSENPMPTAHSNTPPAAPAIWKDVVSKYQQASAPRAIWQLLNTLVPYAAIWYLMYLSLEVSAWLAALLAILAGGFLVRLFIIFHDCGHSSFFKSRRANDVVGIITGILTFTPYYHWR